MGRIRYLVMDVDGTLTDGKVYYSASGEQMKTFDIKDGYGIHELLPSLGIIPIILTGRKSEILNRRCNELGISQVYQGVRNKIEVLLRVCVDLSEIAYIGDDNNDLPCMRVIKNASGIIACPHNASHDVKELCDYVCEKNGGDGCVREFIEWIMYGQD